MSREDWQSTEKREWNNASITVARLPMKFDCVMAALALVKCRAPLRSPDTFSVNVHESIETTAASKSAAAKIGVISMKTIESVALC